MSTGSAPRPFAITLGQARAVVAELESLAEVFDFSEQHGRRETPATFELQALQRDGAIELLGLPKEFLGQQAWIAIAADGTVAGERVATRPEELTLSLHAAASSAGRRRALAARGIDPLRTVMGDSFDDEMDEESGLMTALGLLVTPEGRVVEYSYRYAFEGTGDDGEFVHWEDLTDRHVEERAWADSVEQALALHRRLVG